MYKKLVGDISLGASTTTKIGNASLESVAYPELLTSPISIFTNGGLMDVKWHSNANGCSIRINKGLVCVSD